MATIRRGRKKTTTAKRKTTRTKKRGVGSAKTSSSELTRALDAVAKGTPGARARVRKIVTKAKNSCKR